MNGFMLYTSMLFMHLYKVSPQIKGIKYSLPLTWYGKTGSVIMSNSYLFSQSVLFLVGFSSINLLISFSF